MSEQALRVLLVDDEDSLREPLAKYLRGEPYKYTVEAVPNGIEALRLLEETQGRYDVALIDEVLEEGPGGLELLKRIKSKYPDIEVILFTGWGLQSALEALHAGAYRYFAKPFNPEELAVTIRFAAEQGQARREREILSVLQQVSAAINSSLDLNEILCRTCQAAVKLFGMDHSGLVLFDYDLSQGKVVAEYPDRESLGFKRSFGAVIPVHGIPVEERLVYQKEIINIPDVACETSLGSVRDSLQSLGIQSALIVPVVLQDQVVGSFSLDAIRQPRTFYPHEIELCKSLANQVAVAIQNARLLQETQQRADQLAALRHTTLAVTSQLERQTLLTTIIQQAVGLLQAKSGGIYEYYPERGELAIVADHGRPRNILGNTLKVGEGMAGRLVQSGEPCMIVDDYNAWTGREAKRPFGAVLEVLLKWQDRIIGVLYVDDKVGRKFTEEDARLLGLFADHATIALVNAELVTQDAEKLRRLQRLSEISSEIMSDLGSMALDERLNLIAKRVAEVLEAEVCGISLVKREGYLSWEASYGHREGAFRKGREFTIVSAPKGGLIEHIANEGKVFNAWGAALTDHWAVKGTEKDHVASGRCYSLLALPLRKDDRLIGLLRAENKLSKDGEPREDMHFTQEDEWVLNFFGEAVVVAIEGAELVGALSEQKDHLARLIASSPDGIIAFDTQGNVTGFNEQAQEILGYTAAEVMHTPVARLYYDPQEPRKIGKQLHLTATGRLTNYETFVRSKNGDRLPIRLSATWLYDAAGKRIGSVGYFEDLRFIKETERRLELLLKASHTLAEAESLTEGLQRLAEMMVSLLTHTFCRILVLDESSEFLVVKVAYPIPRSGGRLNWEPGLEQRTAVSDWRGLRKVLEAGSPIVLRWSDEQVQPVLVRFSRWLGLEKDIQSLLIVPLKMGNRIVGLLEVGESRGEERGRLTDAEIELASAIAAETTTLIDRMRLYEITERRKAELEHLHDAAAAMAAAFDLKQVLQIIAEEVKSILQADSSAIWSYDNIRDKFIPEERVAVGIPDEELQRFRDEEPKPGRTAYTVMEKGWIGVTDISSPGFEFLGHSTRELLKRIGVTSFQGIALRVGDELVGVLYVNYKQPRAFGEEDRRPLENLATYAALSLKRARLLDQVSKAKKAAEVVAQVTALGDFRATLSSITQGTQETLGCDAVTLFVYDQTTDRLNHPPVMVGVRYPDRVMCYQEVVPDSIAYAMLRRDESYIVERVSEDAVFRDRRFALDEGIMSCVAIPLKVMGQKVGVMFVNYRTRHRFTADELSNIELFANQAAVAIHNAQLHDETRKRAEALEGLYEAGRALTSTLALDEVLARIAEQALRIVGANPQEGCFSHVALLEQNKLRFIAGFPLEILTDLRQNVGEMDLQKDAKKGIDGRAVITGQSQLVAEVWSEPDYIALRENINIHSQLSVPLKIGERIIGVLSIEHPKPSAFSEEDVDNIELLAAQAAVAIENARQYGETEKSLVARTALAWTGMASSTWRHTIEKHAITIRDQVLLLRRDLNKLPKSASTAERLNMIERLAIQILEKPITAPLGADEGIRSVPINELIRERTKQLWSNEPYKSVRPNLDLTLDDSLTIRTSPEWLRRALDILIDNAVEATAGLPERKIDITSRGLGARVEIGIRDNGRGIPEEMQPKLLVEPIKKPKGAKGLGIGLLFARMIVQAYGGDLRVGTTGPTGTTMIVSLPVEL